MMMRRTNKLPQRKTRGLVLVHKAQVEDFYHRLHIDHGYRKVASWWDAFVSLFKMHNETMNVWSHLIGFICVLFAAINLSFDYFSPFAVSFTEFLVVEAYFVSAVICMFLSTMFHLFGCISGNCFDILLKLDLSGVALLVTGSYIPAVYYGFICLPTLQSFYFIYAAIILVVGLSAPWLPISSHIRPYVMASTVVGGLVPAVHWVIVTPVLFRNSILPYFAGMFIWYTAGFGFFATHIPERFSPNSFWLSTVFSSHTLWHICVLNAIYVWFYFLIHYRAMHDEHECKFHVAE